MLFHGESAVSFAKQGLMVWFQTMIPTLLPFMILTSLSIHLGIHRWIVKVVEPVFYRIFQVNTDSIYCILFGFLCGFPMGARIVAQLYEKKYISREESSYLLTFCNNIGPIYFTNIVLKGIRPRYQLGALAGMYGILLFYGILMRYTLYRKMIITQQKVPIETGIQKNRSKNRCVFIALDDSINTSLNGIATLGGYMIFFNLCTVIPFYILPIISNNMGIYLFANCFLEISSGIQNVLLAQLPVTTKELILLTMVMFGGISCLAQTISCIRNLRISIIPYCIHKILQALTYYIYMMMLYYF